MRTNPHRPPLHADELSEWVRKGFRIVNTNLAVVSHDLRALDVCTLHYSPPVENGPPPTIASLEDAGYVAALPAGVLDEIRQRVDAKAAAEAGRSDCQNEHEGPDHEPGFARVLLDEGFLREHVWRACLRPFATAEDDVVYLETPELPSWITTVPAEARVRNRTPVSPSAVVGLRLSAAQQDAIQQMQINVASYAPTADADPSTAADADLGRPSFLPVLVAVNRANLISPLGRASPVSTLFPDLGCFASFACVIALRKMHEYGLKSLHSNAGQPSRSPAPAPPPLLVVIFSDHALTVWKQESVFDEQERTANRGCAYRCTLLLNEMMDMRRGSEERTILRMGMLRRWAAGQLRSYLDRIVAPP
ncbi:hypothetical protein OC834_003471 [Tilletia horrida]|nr:hypothetical protein OC834_003471 [Tilletia horrida]KAK0539188.1 hypothetical protein OC835_001205 [Tilletia horrida]KAK0560672.1 hypothetical protein OC844_003611 [Tilletia horrida]